MEESNQVTTQTERDESPVIAARMTNTERVMSALNAVLLLNPYQLFATGLLHNPLCNKRTQSCMAVDLMSEADDYD